MKSIGLLDRSKIIVETWHGGQVVWITLDRKTAWLFPIMT